MRVNGTGHVYCNITRTTRATTTNQQYKNIEKLRNNIIPLFRYTNHLFDDIQEQNALRSQQLW